MKIIDYTSHIHIGDKIGQLEVVEMPSRRTKKNVWQVKVKCSCGRTQYHFCANWLRKEYAICRACKVSGVNSYAWTGVGDIHGELFALIRLNAKRIGVSHTVSKQYLWNLFLKQNRKCALSGVDIHFNGGEGKRTASLDRVDSTKGYVKGNVQWIHKNVNRMKNEYPQSYYVDMCKLVASRFG